MGVPFADTGREPEASGPSCAGQSRPNAYRRLLKPTGPRTPPKHIKHQPPLPKTKIHCGLVLGGVLGILAGSGGFWDPVGFNTAAVFTDSCWCDLGWRGGPLGSIDQ